jgi:lipoprotein NlpI
MRWLACLGTLLLCLHGSNSPRVHADEKEDELLQKATLASRRGDGGQAIELLSDLLKSNPNQSLAYYLRGRENFRAGHIKESVSDLDKHVELDPKAASRQWERGISYYYVGEFEKGAKQFELYQTFHDQDVENSAWRYLCVAHTEGVEKAAKTLLPISDDRRVPMMQIYDLYRGKLKPADVLAAAEAGEPTKEGLNRQLFYAHLYIGLWHEAAGEKDLARKHILEAEKHKIDHYMWDVAHVHADLLRAKDKPAPKP